MMAVEKQKRFKAIVVHGKPSFYEENSLARKLADRGVDVSRVYFTTFAQNAKRQDWRGVDLVVLITSSVDRNVAKAVREESKVRGVKFFEISHRVSEWGELENHVGYVSSPSETPPEVLIPLRPKPTLSTVPDPLPALIAAPSVVERIAGELRDNEELAKLWEREATDARRDLAASLKEVEQLRLELEGLKKTSGVVVREQLAADLSRKEEERKAALRSHEEVLARLEAAETLRKKAESEVLEVRGELERRPRVTAKVSPDESAVLKKLRAIIAACGAGVIDNDETVTKIAKVLS